jgi:NAD(P)-dependent dehydrogenase (short-subunit alcohol dehydrogenase family)
MALNVKSMFYSKSYSQFSVPIRPLTLAATVGLEPLLRKGATPQNPGRVINIASVAGIATGDPTSGDAGGLAAPGTGTYSCMFNSSHCQPSSLTFP